MTGRARRATSAWLAGVAAILPLASPAAAAGLPQAATRDAFAPPATPMILTRTLRRPLPDGQAVISRRRYEVHFVPVGGGFRIDGQLIDAAVDAPPALAALAALERARPDTGLFPILLDPQGRIAGGDGPAPSDTVQQAADIAATRIAGAGLSATETAGAQSFVARLRASPARTPWPEDLFRPMPGERSDTRPLPGGSGSATVRIDARAASHGGLLDSLVRTVTTQLGADRRMTEETWTLRPAPAVAN